MGSFYMILILCGCMELINHWYENSHPLSWEGLQLKGIAVGRALTA